MGIFSGSRKLVKEKLKDIYREGYTSRQEKMREKNFYVL